MDDVRFARGTARGLRPPDERTLVLRSALEPDAAVRSDELFAVTVVWGSQPSSGWKIWLTTTDRRRLCCSDDDIDDPALASWLARLPDWETRRLRIALERPGLHLVWRRPDP